MLEGFEIIEFDENSAIFERIKGKSYKGDCTLPAADLRLLKVKYVDSEGSASLGELMVNVHIAEDVLDIFRKLYEAKYPLGRVALVDEYDADDERSMADNNCSAFNFRFISYTNTVSKHGLGLAIDINPLYNPYIKTVEGRLSIEPAGSAPFVDRSKDFPMKIDHEDLAFKLFSARGFEWGGDWKDALDYQHFEVPTEIIKLWYPGY